MRFLKRRPVHLNRLAAVLAATSLLAACSAGASPSAPAASPPAASPSAVASPSGPAASPAASADDLNALLPEEIRTKGVIKVLTDPSFNPISFYKEGSTTEIIGSDPDILRAMGEKLGVTIEFEPTAFPGMLPGVESGRGDLAGGGLTDSEEREKAVTFVDDFQLGMLYVVKKGSTVGISSDLLSACGKKIAFTTGALSATQVDDLRAACVDAGQPEPEQVAVSDINATLLAVRSERVDVSFYDDFGFDSVNEAANGELEAFKIDGYPKQYWGFAVAKDNTELADALLAALEAIIADGTYAEILETYNLNENALTEPGINLETTLNR